MDAEKRRCINRVQISAFIGGSFFFREWLHSYLVSKILKESVQCAYLPLPA